LLKANRLSAGEDPRILEMLLRDVPRKLWTGSRQERWSITESLVTLCRFEAVYGDSRQTRIVSTKIPCWPICRSERSRKSETARKYWRFCRAAARPIILLAMIPYSRLLKERAFTGDGSHHLLQLLERTCNIFGHLRQIAELYERKAFYSCMPAPFQRVFNSQRP